MTATPSTPAGNLIEHAAECAAKLARIATKHGATEDEAVKIGIDLVVTWIKSDLTLPATQLNARAAIQGRLALHRRASAAEGRS